MVRFLGVTAAALVFGATEAPDPWSYFLNYGLVGLLLIMVATGKFFVTRRELDKADDETALWRAESMRLNALIQDKYVPALEAARTATEAVLGFMRDAARR